MDVKKTGIHTKCITSTAKKFTSKDGHKGDVNVTLTIQIILHLVEKKLERNARDQVQNSRDQSQTPGSEWNRSELSENLFHNAVNVWSGQIKHGCDLIRDGRITRQRMSEEVGS